MRPRLRALASAVLLAAALLIGGLAAPPASAQTPSLVLSSPSLEVSEGNAADYTVALATQPSATVTVTITGYLGTDLTLDKTSLTFTTTGWDTAQNVRVSAQGDDDATHDKVSLTHTASGGGYDSVSADLSVTVTDTTRMDLVGVVEDIREGESTTIGAMLPMTLDEDVRIDVEVTLKSGHAREYELSANTTLTIAAGEKDSTGEVIFTSLDDFTWTGTAYYLVTLTPDHERVDPISKQFAVQDDDNTGTAWRVTPASIFENGGEATLQAYKTRLHDGVVKMTVSVEPSDRVSLSGTTLTFEPGALYAAETLTITAVDNAADEPDQTVSISASVTEGRGVRTPPSLELTIEDDDGMSPEVALVLTPSRVREGSFSIVTAVTSGPLNDEATITVSAAPGHVDTRTEDYELSANTVLTIPAGGTRSAGTVTIAAVDDSLSASRRRREVTVSGTVAGGGVAAPADETLTILEDDSRLVVYLIATPATITEGEVSTITMRAVQPAPADVSVTVQSYDDAIELSADPVLKITKGETESTGMVTITALQDDDAYEEVPTLFGQLGPNSGFVTMHTVSVFIVDDDAEGGQVWISPVPYQVYEGGSSTIIAQAASALPDEVTVTVAVDELSGNHTADPGDYTMGANRTLTIPAGLTRSVGHVTLTSVDDGYYQGSRKVALKIESVTGIAQHLVDVHSNWIIRDDEDQPRVTLDVVPAGISEDGGQSTVTARLNTLVDGEVEVTVMTAPAGMADADDYRQTGTLLTIPAGQKNSTGAVTIDAVNDDVDGPDEHLVVTGTVDVVGMEESGIVWHPYAEGLTIHDDDEPPGLVLSKASLGLAEGGSESYTVALATKPSANVTVTKDLTVTVTDDEAEGGDLRLVGGPNAYEGRLEVFYKGRWVTGFSTDGHGNPVTEFETSPGEWGTVCDDRFTGSFNDGNGKRVENIAAGLACRLMGYEDGEVVPRVSGGMNVAPSAPDLQPIWLDDVRCAAGSTHWTNKEPSALHHCYNAGIGLNNCTHEEDVHLKCTGTAPVAVGKSLSGEFQNAPRQHSGAGTSVKGAQGRSPATTFTLDLVLSEPVVNSDTDIEDNVIQVNGGSLEDATLASGTDDTWVLTIAPSGDDDVTVRVEGGGTCGDPGVLCTSDGTTLDETVTETIEGPEPTPTAAPLTAEFTNGPAEHDGQSPFTIEIVLSEVPTGIKNPEIRTNLQTEGGQVTRVQVVNRNKAHRRITVEPAGNEDVRLWVDPAPDCTVPRHGFCTPAGTTLESTVSVTIPGPTVPAPVPFTVAFANVPEEHGGKDARFSVDLVFSAEPVPKHNEDLRRAVKTRDALRRGMSMVNGDRKHRNVRIDPTGHQPVEVWVPRRTNCAAADAICDEHGTPIESEIRVTIPGPVAVSVADARVEEAAGTVLKFAVTLDRERHEAVSVDYATEDGTATAGVDYTATSGTLEFLPGETAKTVSVAIIDDAHDEGEETMGLRLSNPVGARIADGEAIGTIENTDHMPQAWLARFGRTVGSQVVEAVSERVDGRPPASHFNVGGVSLGGVSLGGAPRDDARPLTPQDWLAAQMAEGQEARRPDERTLTERDLLLGSSFHLLSQPGEDGGAAWSAWGRVSTGGFSAEADGTAMDGDVVTGLLGFDAEWRRLLAGVLLLRSEAEGSYRLLEGGDSGDIDSALTGVYPYARLRLGGRLSVWAVAGVGTGDLTLVRAEETIDTGLDVRLGAFGARGTLPAVGGVDLAVKSDVLWVRTASDAVAGGLAATSADVNRLRLILEGGRPWTLSSGAVLAPSVEIGLRHDGGDAETGAGVEAGAGLQYSAGMLSVEAQVRTLLAHDAAGYEEWGASGSIRLSPNASGLGPSLALQPSWGAVGSGVARLWSQPDASALIPGSGAASAGGRVDAELGWGLAALRGRGVLTPYARVALVEGEGRSWHLGSRLALAESAPQPGGRQPAGRQRHGARPDIARHLAVVRRPCGYNTDCPAMTCVFSGHAWEPGNRC